MPILAQYIRGVHPLASTAHVEGRGVRHDVARAMCAVERGIIIPELLSEVVGYLLSVL